MYYLYLIECNDGSIYTGITIDVERRFEEHKEGKGGNYTRAKRAKKLLYTEKHPDRSTAQKREAEIKSWPRTQKEALFKKK